MTFLRRPEDVLKTPVSAGNADINLKIKIFNASVLNVLPYSTATYVIDAAFQNKINAFLAQSLRIILNIGIDDHVRNEYIHKQANTKPPIQRVTKIELSFLERSIRRNKDELIQHTADVGRDDRRQPISSTLHIIISTSVEEKVMRDAAVKELRSRKS